MRILFILTIIDLKKLKWGFSKYKVRDSLWQEDKFYVIN